MKITGFDQLNRQLDEAQKALKMLEGELGTVSYEANDPSSIEAAIATVDALIDERLGPYLSNPIIGPLATEMKEHYRVGIIERATKARLEASTRDD